MCPTHSPWLAEPEFRTALLSIPQSGVPSALTSVFFPMEPRAVLGHCMGRSGPGSKTHPHPHATKWLACLTVLCQDSSRERVLFFLKTKEYWPGIKSRYSGLAVESLRDYRPLLQTGNVHSTRTHQGCCILHLCLHSSLCSESPGYL